MLCAVIALVFAFVLIGVVIRAPAGNERMRQISGRGSGGRQGVFESSGDHDQLNRSDHFHFYSSFSRNRTTAIGFVIGAFCSLSAGYIGMRIAVIANVRTTQPQRSLL